MAIVFLAVVVGAVVFGLAGMASRFVEIQNVSAAPGAVAHILDNGTSSGTISTGLGIFTEGTIALLVGFMFVGAFSLQVARNYFLRTLNKFTLRLGADIWWLAYVLIRDALMFFVVFLGFVVFMIGTYGDYPVAVPFMPFAVVCVAFALFIKLVRDADEDEKTNRIVTLLITAGAGLYLSGILLVTENIVGYPEAGYITNSNGSIATATGGTDFWTFMFNNFSSTVNVSLATNSFYVAFAALSVLGAFAFLWVMKDSLILKAPKKDLGNKPPSSPPSTRSQVVTPAADKTSDEGA